MKSPRERVDKRAEAAELPVDRSTGDAANYDLVVVKYPWHMEAEQSPPRANMEEAGGSCYNSLVMFCRA